MPLGADGSEVGGEGVGGAATVGAVGDDNLGVGQGDAGVVGDKDWVAPRYLTEGIAWLAADDVPPSDPVLAGAIAVAVDVDL